MATIVRFALWTAALWLLWEVVVGTTQSTELIAGAIAAAATALFVGALRRVGSRAFELTVQPFGSWANR